MNCIFAKAQFVKLESGLVINVASILEARMKQLKITENRASFNILEYTEFHELDPVMQVER
jgi:hypothetical protein